MALLILWALITFWVCCGAATCLAIPIDPNEKRNAARVFFLAPIWPVLLIWWIRHLWAVADWRRHP